MRRVSYAVALGVLCHTSFVVAVALMGYEVFFGFTKGVFPIGGAIGRWCNILLLLQFPIFHSLLLSSWGRKILTRLAPAGMGADLSTTTFATIAALQLLLVFTFWTPTSTVWFHPHGALLTVWSLAYGAAWILLAKAISDASLALHTGFLGWGAVAQGRKPSFAPPATSGLYRNCRQPIYLAFALILFLGPIWTLDHLFFALLWGGYCFVGPLLKERRLLARHGAAYRKYQEDVPYIIPRLRIAPSNK